jgi:hypothetical protein
VAAVEDARERVQLLDRGGGWRRLGGDGGGQCRRQDVNDGNREHRKEGPHGGLHLALRHQPAEEREDQQIAADHHERGEPGELLRDVHRERLAREMRAADADQQQRQRHAREVADFEWRAALDAIEFLLVGVEHRRRDRRAGVGPGAGEADAEHRCPAVVAPAAIDPFVFAIDRTGDRAAVEVDLVPVPEVQPESGQQ